jgi:ribosome-binding protein aMBF1 (putative translation factor)
LLIETGAVGLSKIMQGIQFSWVAPRSLLVYVAREWCGIKARVLAEHLNRDASMVSRLHAVYAAARDKRSESELQRLLRIKSTTQPVPDPSAPA